MFPIDREGYTLDVDRAYDGPGDYTLTATAKDGFAFEGDGDPFVRTRIVHLDGALTGEVCAPPCEDEIKGVWHNYTGNFVKNGLDANHDGIPDLNDPLWHALPATPGGQHDFALRGVNKPYQPGKPKGNGDWFYWSDEGTKCD